MWVGVERLAWVIIRFVMTLTLNGTQRDVPEEVRDVRGLIDHLDMSGQAVAVEVNLELVPRRAYEGRALREGDRVELVTLVGGG